MFFLCFDRNQNLGLGAESWLEEGHLVKGMGGGRVKKKVSLHEKGRSRASKK